jgi:2-keto-4-pentenoate hydratase/2-oxohepta-3-ene-1,7-dioic acid hydratase in catechol pathway
MQLVSFEGPQGRSSYGILGAKGIIDVGIKMPTTVDLSSLLADIPALARFKRDDVDYDATDVRLLPPVPDSRRIICVGLNYKAHIAETGNAVPAHPILFPRYPQSLVGPGANLVRPRVSERFDFAGELAVVIGKPGRAIPRESALDHVAGYSCFNDGSVRDWQKHTTQFLPGKNFSRSGSFGPYLVTRDEVGEVDALTLITRLNGAVVQRTKLDDLLFDVPALIAYVSQIWEVRPGDVIATGTPGGVGTARNPPLWMKPGDLVEVEINSLGILANRVIAEEALR